MSKRLGGCLEEQRDPLPAEKLASSHLALESQAHLDQMTRGTTEAAVDRQLVGRHIQAEA